jgi:hypothetical protein
MKFLRLLSALLVFGSIPAGRISAADESAAEKPKSAWNLELIPRAFQKNPSLEITVISELTAAGKKLPAASPKDPVYYLLHTGGYRARGATIQQKPLPAEEVEKILQRALKTSGYLPAPESYVPSILVVYTWGPHNTIDPETAASPDLILRNILDRAAVAGGDKFAAELAAAIQASASMAQASAPSLGASSEGATALGAAAAFEQMAALADPVKRFRARSTKNDFLVSQATSNCYYLIASAYDFLSLSTPQRQLLWRTRMTVSADGVSQLEAIPMMISAAAPFLGRDMPEAEIIRKPSVQKGRVEVGTPTLADPAPPKPAEKK